MHGLFQVEGRFYTVTSKILDLIVITLLWGIGCIPLVTILTSTASLYQTAVKCIRYDRGKAVDEFLNAYRKNLKQGIGLTALFEIAGTAIILGDYYVFFRLPSRSGFAFLLAVGMVIWTVLYLVNLVWIVPVFSRFADTTGKLLRLNYVIATRYLARSILMLLLLGIGLLLIFISLPLALFIPAFIALVISYLSEPGLHKYMPKIEADAGDWRYGVR